MSLDLGTGHPTLAGPHVYPARQRGPASWRRATSSRANLGSRGGGRLAIGRAASGSPVLARAEAPPPRPGRPPTGLLPARPRGRGRGARGSALRARPAPGRCSSRTRPGAHGVRAAVPVGAHVLYPDVRLLSEDEENRAESDAS